MAPTDAGQIEDAVPKLDFVDMTDATKLKLLKVFSKTKDVNNFNIVCLSIANKSVLVDVFTRACRFGQNNLVKMMIDVGVNVNTPDTGHGSTGLMFAAQAGHQSTVQLLLGHGADATLRNSCTDKTARHYSTHSTINDILDNAVKAQEAAKKVQEIEQVRAEIRAELHAEHNCALEDLRTELRAEHNRALEDLRTELHAEHNRALGDLQTKPETVTWSDSKPVVSKTPDGDTILVTLNGHVCQVYFQKQGSLCFVEC